MSARTFYTLSGVGISLLLLLVLRSLYSPNPSAPNAAPNAPFADATQQQKAESANKAWDAYILTPEGKAAEAARKNANKDAAKEESRRLVRYMYAKKCGDVLLDMGYDLQCLDSETNKTLLIIGKPVNRVFVHQVAPIFHTEDLRRMGYLLLEFSNEELFSNYTETFDVGPIKSQKPPTNVPFPPPAR